MAEPPAIETRGLSKTYPNGVRALVDLDLRVERGESVRVSRPEVKYDGVLVVGVAAAVALFAAALLVERRDLQVP